MQGSSMRVVFHQKRICRTIVIILLLSLIILAPALFNGECRAMLRHSLLVLTSLFVGSRAVCDIPPSQWCEDSHNAEKCRVTDQCVEWLKYSSEHRPVPDIPGFRSLPFTGQAKPKTGPPYQTVTRRSEPLEPGQGSQPKKTEAIARDDIASTRQKGRDQNDDNESEAPTISSTKPKSVPALIAPVEPVHLGVYFESLCPDSTRFFRTQLGPVFEELAGTGILNLTLIPYGNAEEKQNSSGWWEFTCQHGKDECHGNILQTCSIHQKRYQGSYFPFIRCMMVEIEEGEEVDPAAQKCSAGHNVNYRLLRKCARSRKGNILEHKMAVRTEKLQPKKTYVPWVTINGVHTEPMEKAAEANLLKLVCDSYKGKKPPVCSPTSSTDAKVTVNQL